jgi:hypothetical protein
LTDRPIVGRIGRVLISNDLDPKYRSKDPKYGSKEKSIQKEDTRKAANKKLRGKTCNPAIVADGRWG